MTGTAYHCELALIDEGLTEVSADVLVEVTGDQITAVTPGVAPPPRSIRLHGLTLPGLANAHSHAFHRALRGRTHAGVGSFWTWRDQMYALAGALDPDSYHRLARATFAEMACAGISCVGEFHYVHHQLDGMPYRDPNAVAEALVTAANEAGLRITLLDTCYLHGGIGVAPSGVQLRFSDGNVDHWVERVEALAAGDVIAAPHAHAGAAIHSVRAVDPDSIGQVARWALDHKRVLHAHVSEQPAENEQCVAAFGVTPIELLAAHGALDATFTAVHGTHLSGRDVGLLAEHRCSVCVCPTTERDLADGIGPTTALRDAGIALTLGSDSHAVIDLFEEARALELDERLASQVRGNHRVAELLDAATASGHRSLGWPNAGRIAVGGIADLVSVGFDNVRMAGADPEHALATAVYAATAADVHHVVIGGRVVVREGRHTSIDVTRELASSIADVWGSTS